MKAGPPGPIGKLVSKPPYRAVCVNPFRSVWAIYGSEGFNAWGDGGRTLFSYPGDAETVIRSHGFEPGERGHAKWG